MHITTSVFINDDESGLHHDYEVWLERLAPGGSWRRQVSCVGTGQERRFAGLAELFEFLESDAADKSEGTGRNAEASDTA